jgi:hypothetical protein
VGIPGGVTGLRPRRRGRAGGAVRGLSGLLVGGLVALALLLLAGWWYAQRTGLPGPGRGMLVGHGVGAVAAVVTQVWADRRADRTGTLVAAGLAVLVAGGLTAVWLF